MENTTSLQQQLLEAGVHFGHLKKKWNPKMLPYIFAEKKGIHIIDLNKTVESADKFDIVVNATGGGVKGQAEATKLGIARALLEVSADYRPALKAAGLVKRDPRSVERKKPGRKKARKSFQFSKR